MKKMILVLFLVSATFAQSQTAQAPQLKPAADAQAEFQQARERVKNAQIAAELARRELDAANEHANSVLNKIRAEHAWPESKFDASLDKDGNLFFSAKPVTAKK
jgi:hypothetical protein